MKRARHVQPEVLDGLNPDDPSARRARRDLRRINGLMGTQGQLLRALRAASLSRAAEGPLRILELGAGDGSLLLAVARRWSPRPPVELTLLDRQPLVDDETVRAYARLSWAVRTEIADARDWAAQPDLRAPRWDAVVANLFLHHFEDDALGRLLAAVARRAGFFFACEPRRDLLALAGSRMVGLVGAGPVTRRDAVLSVQAGFRASELSRLWPSGHDGWQLEEGRAGPFGHRFLARRVGPRRAPIP